MASRGERCIRMKRPKDPAAGSHKSCRRILPTRSSTMLSLKKTASRKSCVTITAVLDHGLGLVFADLAQHKEDEKHSTAFRSLCVPKTHAARGR